jgi:hypothetical protein
MADPKNPPPALGMAVATLKAPRYEYEILRAKARQDAQGIITGVTGIEDTTITRMAREGWRVKSASFSGRKLLAVILERPVERKAKKKKRAGEKKAAPSDPPNNG